MNKILAVIILSFTPALWAQSYTISTYAGGGTLPPLPANASSVSMGNISAIAADSAGNFYVADSFANLVFKISPTGTAIVFAGTGSVGFSGDGGLATSAQLNYPQGLALDGHGNLFVSDYGNGRIREVSGAGIITTIAGNGVFGYTGDGGPATQAELSGPTSLALDSGGDLFICDSYNNVIRKLSAAGMMSTFAGNGTSGYSGDGGPATSASLNVSSGVAVDMGGNVFIADTNNCVIRKVAVGGIISTFAGNGTYGFSGDGGPALSAGLSYPYGLATDEGSNLYIADWESQRIREVTPAGIITTVAGDGLRGFSGDGGPAAAAQLEFPQSVAAGNNGTLYIGDTGNNRVRQVTSLRTIVTAAGNGGLSYSGDNGPATRALLAIPQGVAIKADGSVVLSDSGNDRVRGVSITGNITTIAGNGNVGYSGDNSLATEAQMNNPDGVATDASGNTYVVDAGNSVVRKIDRDGVITTIAGTGYFAYRGGGDGGPAIEAPLGLPRGVAVDSSGAIYISDAGNCDIRKVSPDGLISTIAGDGNYGYSGDNGPAVLAELNQPQSITLDDVGNLYIADRVNSVIRKVNSSGIINTVAGNGIYGYSGDNGPAIAAQLSWPFGVAVDGAGNLYISDSGYSKIRKVSSSGIITTIAGAFTGYEGDGGPAIDAGIYGPNQIAVGPNGTIYFAETENNAIRTLTVCIQSLSSTAGADSTAQTLSIPIAAASTCNWAASNLPSWITSASSGTGSGTLLLTLQANTTGADRTAAITVNGVVVSVTQDFTAELFQDVQPGIYYFDAVDLLKAKMITSGCAVDEYCPTLNVLRSQMAIFIVRAVLGGDNFTYSQTPYFTDVQPTDFGFAWIQKMYELGVTNGCGPALYCPNDSVTRAQMAVFIIRARYGSQTVFDYPPTPYFTDVPTTGFAYNYIQRMKEDNITSGCGVSSYCPNNPVTRGDMAVFVMRGAFNQLLPPTEAIIVSVSPTTITNGTTATFTVTGLNTNFVSGSTNVNAVPGLIVNSVTVTNANTLQMSVTANTTSTPQPLSIWVTDTSEEAVLPNGLTVQ